MTANQQEHILSGYKVLDFTQHIAGPTATRLLVEMGANGLAAILQPVTPYFLWRPTLRDPDDEMALDAAVNGRAAADRDSPRNTPH
jgi:hypothetical protein